MRRRAVEVIIGSAEALPILCVRCARWERERERERYRERERERDTEREREREREREIHREREREREREKERERERERRSDVTLVALKLAKSFALVLAKNLHPMKWRWVHTFRCQNVALFETVRMLRKIHTLCNRFTSVKWRDRGSKHRKTRSNFRLHRPNSSHRKNESN